MRCGRLLACHRFIPHGTPHEVLNLSATSAISANYLDQSNVEAAVKQARQKLRHAPPDGPRALNLRSIADSLDEIEWPTVEDDLAEEDRQRHEAERMVGRFPAHERCMYSRLVRLKAPSA